MADKNMKETTIDEINSRIYYIRGQKVMLDRDLADLYGVETKRLKEQVKRNIKRFPEDFMFQLTDNEFNNWRSQIATSNSDKMGLRYSPMAFTEHGVAMLSSVLKSKRAINVNIQIMRTFTKLRRLLSGNEDLMRKIDEIEKKYDEQFMIVFDAIKQLIKEDDKPKNKIGF